MKQMNALVVKFALAMLFALAGATVAWAEPLFVGYYPDWGKWMSPSYTVDKVPYAKLTHVLWSFVSPNEDGSLRGDAVDDPTDLDKMVELAHKAGTKVVLSLGGGGLCENFAAVTADDNLRAKFVAALMEFVKAHDLDGLDMDWETPENETQTANFDKLISELRAALPQGKTLSAALPCSDWNGKHFNAETLVENLDWLGFMTYDITGDWDEKARFDSPLYPNVSNGWTTWSWKQTAQYWAGRGVPASKMVFGIPMFGFVFDGATRPGTDFTKGTYTSYAKIVAQEGWTFHFDDVSMEPYAVGDNKFATFEDPHSAAIKSRWVKENNYAGILVWEVSQDYTDGTEQPILDSIAVALRGETSTAIRPVRKARSAGGATSGVKVDVLGHKVRGERPIILLDIGRKR